MIVARSFMNIIYIVILSGIIIFLTAAFVINLIHIVTKLLQR